MNRTTIGACALVLALAGCETTGGPQSAAYASAPKQDCKAVVISGQESVGMQNERGTGGDEMKRTEGTLALGRLKMNESRNVRSPAAPEAGVVDQAFHECY
jgi:hypothetical protein